MGKCLEYFTVYGGGGNTHEIGRYAPNADNVDKQGSIVKIPQYQRLNPFNKAMIDITWKRQVLAVFLDVKTLDPDLIKTFAEYSNIFECNKKAGLIPQVQIIQHLHDVGLLVY